MGFPWEPGKYFGSQGNAITRVICVNQHETSGSQVIREKEPLLRGVQQTILMAYMVLFHIPFSVKRSNNVRSSLHQSL